MKSSFAGIAGIVTLVTGLMTVLPARAHEDEGSQAGHSVHGEAYDEGPRQAAYLMGGMPDVRFPVSTTNELAQRFFNQGVGQLHGFWYFEAERSFRQVAQLDTNCVMAGWGMAMASVKNPKRALDLVQRTLARTNSASLTRREILYIDALARLHGADTQPPAKEEGKKKVVAAGDGDSKRNRAFVKALEQIVEEFPDDLEAKAFLIFKVWEDKGQTPISSHMALESMAREILAVSPMHPVHHARIHFWNGEADRRALEAAARCGQGSPGIAHMWHMPGHTYSALHRYADGAWQQEASARVDHAYMIRNRVMPDQIHNFAHNNEWLVQNLSYLGRVTDAMDLARNMIELPRHPRYNSLSKPPKPEDGNVLWDSTVTANEHRQNSAKFGRTRLVELLVRWELWDTLLALGDTLYLDDTEAPEEQVKKVKALGLAAFATGNLKAGNARIAEMEALIQRQKNLRHADVDAAEERSRKDKLEESRVSQAMTDAMRTQTDHIKRTEKDIAELRLFEALAREDVEEAKERLDEVKDLPKERLSQVWLRLGDKDKALKLAKEALDGGTNQVQILANYVEALWRYGRKDDAVETFARLREVGAHSDLGLPILARLEPLLRYIGAPEDWRRKPSPATDLGNRPPLDSLGPFRWHPSPAPSFQLVDSQRKTHSTESYKGRPFIALFYLGHGCKHCLEQLNAFAPMNDQFEKAGLSILAVSTDTVEGLEKTFKQSKAGDGFPFPIVADPTLQAFKNFRAYDDFEAMPLHGTFLVDGDGLIRWQDISFEPFTQVEFLLKESLRLLKLPASGMLPPVEGDRARRLTQSNAGTSTLPPR